MTRIPRYNKNVISFAGDESHIRTVLNTMVANLYEAGPQDYHADPEAFEEANLSSDSKLGDIVSALDGAELVRLLDPNSDCEMTNEDPFDHMALSSQKNTEGGTLYQLVLTFYTQYGLAEDEPLDAFCEGLPLGRYAIAACSCYQGEDVAYFNIGNMQDWGEYVCGPDLEPETANKYGYFGEEEGCDANEVRELLGNYRADPPESAAARFAAEPVLEALAYWLSDSGVW